MQNPTSIKQILLSIVKEGIDETDIRAGVVISENPLKIALKNNAKMILSEVDLVVPIEMKKRNETVHLKMNGIQLNTPAGTGTADIDRDAEITIDGSPKSGDIVYLLRYGRQRRYYLIGKG